MNRLFLIGDIHLGLGYPNNVDKWLNIHKKYFDDFLFPFLEKNVTDGDAIITLGDFFDNRNYVPINILNYGVKIVDRLSHIAPLHMIIGNHDLWTKTASGENSVNIMRYINNVNIYDATKILDFCGKKLLMMPFIEKRLDQIKAIDDNNQCDYLFCHSDLNGARMHLSNILQNNPDKIDIDNFAKFQHVYSGHIHIRQESKNFSFVGSIFQMDINDMDNQKGITILDVNTGKSEFIKNDISPVFKKIVIKTDDDIQQLQQIGQTKDYIDVSISNNMLISDKKVRRKIEEVLENGNFAKIDFVDDVLQTDDDANEEILLESTDKPMDYDKFTLDYIKNQPYDDIFKEKIIDEFNKIIKIYKSNDL